MRIQRFSFVDILFLAAVIAAIPVGMFHFSIGLYTQATIAWGASAVGFAVLLGWNPGAATETARGIEPVDSIFAVSAAAKFRVVAVQTPCSLGYGTGDTWSVDAQGHLSRPLCRAATTSLAAVINQRLEAGQGVTCRCPLAMGPLTFAMEAT